MGVKYDLAVKVGSYTNAQGEEKNRYVNIGVILEGDSGPYMLLDRTFNPAGVKGSDGRDKIIVSMFKPRQNDTAPTAGNDDDWE
jgi:hypothetical protein